MASILTNTSAMVALQTLRGINANLTQTQNEIATGKSIASAKDNSAIWAISKVMEADVSGFRSISSSLSLGESTVAVARQAAESISDLLTDIKGKVVAAQEQNVDRSKIQTDIEAMTDQINSIVKSAQFNGLNLVQGTEEANILGSLDRNSDGTVTANNITIARQDLTTSAGVSGIGSGGTDLTAQMQESDGSAFTNPTAVAGTANTATITLTGDFDDTETATITVGGQTVTFTSSADDTTATAARDDLLSRLQALDLDDVTFVANGAGGIDINSTLAFDELAVSTSVNTPSGAGDSLITSLNGTGSLSLTSGNIAQRAEEIFFTTAAAVQEGNSYRVTIDGTGYDYIAGPDEDFTDVARGLKTAIDAAGLSDFTTKVVIDEATGQSSLKIDNAGSSVNISVAAMDGGTASGGLFGLDSLDVTTDAGATAALDNIETLINASIDAAASFGSAQGRIETQSEFISKLTDSLRAGIGALVDADMEEASARLQALQVQQQLGIQSLSIANQAPQSILALFR